MRISLKNRQKIKKVASKYGLRTLFVFGSAARGDMHAQSDIDIGFDTGRALTEREEMFLSLALAESFGTDKEIDLVNVKNASPLLLRLMTEDAVPLFGTPSAFDALDRKATKLYIDAQPLFDLTKEYVRNKAAFLIARSRKTKVHSRQR